MTREETAKNDKMFLEELKKRGYKFEDLTCCDCKDKGDCLWSFDLYNTNGDCLANK